ncbi:hypothetical protein SGPA1_10545 [Streptomyces misionensis JCM 4497]
MVLHGRADHRHLLPAQLPRRPAEAREHDVLPERGRLPAGRVPGLQAVPPGHQPRLPGVEPARRPGGARHAADRRRRRGPRGRARPRRQARLQHPPGGAAAPRRAGRGPPRTGPRPARPDRAAADRDHRAAHGGDRLRGRVLLHPHLQRHRPRGLRPLPERTAGPRPRPPDGRRRHPRHPLPAPAVPRPAQPGQPLRPPRRHRRTRRRGVARRRLPPHPAAAVRPRDRRPHPPPRPHRLPPHPRRPARPRRGDQPLPPAARPGRRPGRRGRPAAHRPAARPAGRRGAGPPGAAHRGRGRVRRPGRARTAGLHGRRPHPRGPPGHRPRQTPGRPRGRAHPSLPVPRGAGRRRPRGPGDAPHPAHHLHHPGASTRRRHIALGGGIGLGRGTRPAARPARLRALDGRRHRHARPRRPRRLPPHRPRHPARGRRARSAVHPRRPHRPRRGLAPLARVRGAVSVGDRQPPHQLPARVRRFHRDVSHRDRQPVRPAHPGRRRGRRRPVRSVHDRPAAPPGRGELRPARRLPVLLRRHTGAADRLLLRRAAGVHRPARAARHPVPAQRLGAADPYPLRGDPQLRPARRRPRQARRLPRGRPRQRPQSRRHHRPLPPRRRHRRQPHRLRRRPGTQAPAAGLRARHRPVLTCSGRSTPAGPGRPAAGAARSRWVRAPARRPARRTVSAPR